jgi:hypothetical protein
MNSQNVSRGSNPNNQINQDNIGITNNKESKKKIGYDK